MSKENFSDAYYVPLVPSGDIADFDLLSNAILRDEAAVIRTRRRSDGEEISLIVVVDVFDDGRTSVTPIAELVGLNDEFDPPTSSDYEPLNIS